MTAPILRRQPRLAIIILHPLGDQTREKLINLVNLFGRIIEAVVSELSNAQVRFNPPPPESVNKY
jgi:hypothetical protein